MLRKNASAQRNEALDSKTRELYRQLEVQVTQLEDSLETQGLSRAEIDARVTEYRQQHTPQVNGLTK